MVDTLDEDTFREKVFDYTQHDAWQFAGYKPAVLEFFVPWCPHCQAMMPRYEEVSRDVAGQVDCYRVDMEAHPGLARLFQVTNFPTFFFISPGHAPKHWVGEMEVQDLRGMISQELGV